MLRFATALCLLVVSSVGMARTNTPPKPASLPINAFIVKEVGKPDLLMVKNKDMRVEPASLTKILTSIIAIESGRLNEEVTIPYEATEVEPSKAGFKPGEKIRLMDLVKAAMIASSNDAAFSIGIHLSGSTAEFAEVMNAKARMIGMRNSNFTNPAGFDRGPYAGHYSTAGDLLRLTEYAIRNPMFNEVARLETTFIVELETDRGFILDNHNKLLERYPYAVGIKTGFTRNAGPCLIARAQKDGKDMLLVMMNAKNRWNTAEDLFEKAFAMNEPEPEIVEEVSDDAPVRKPKGTKHSGKPKKSKSPPPTKKSSKRVASSKGDSGSKASAKGTAKPSKGSKSPSTVDRKSDSRKSGGGKSSLDGDRVVAARP